MMNVFLNRCVQHRFARIFTLPILIFALAGCASMQFDNYQFHDEEDIFSTDFSVLPGEIRNLDHVHYGNGMLHSRAPEGDATGWWIDTPMTRNGKISFQMKLGDTINPEHPASHINLLAGHGSRLCINFDDQWGTGYFWHAGDSAGHGSVSSRNLETERWYQIDLLLAEKRVLVFVDGTHIGSVPISDSLPGWGVFGVECHNELWIDSVTITKYGSYEVARRN
jgi:hypothetical protein